MLQTSIEHRIALDSTIGKPHHAKLAKAIWNAIRLGAFGRIALTNAAFAVGKSLAGRLERFDSFADFIRFSCF